MPSPSAHASALTRAPGRRRASSSRGCASASAKRSSCRLPRVPSQPSQTRHPPELHARAVHRALAAESHPPAPLSSTQELSTGPAVPPCSPRLSLPNAPESAHPSPSSFLSPALSLQLSL
eukprot:6793897-Prymnesium_polylepis.4